MKLRSVILDGEARRRTFPSMRCRMRSRPAAWSVCSIGKTRRDDDHSRGGLPVRPGEVERTPRNTASCYASYWLSTNVSQAHAGLWRIGRVRLDVSTATPLLCRCLLDPVVSNKDHRHS